jgi:hypothetical protein
MKNSSRLILLFIAAALGFWLWIIFFPSPEKVIKRQLVKLAHDVSFSQGENAFVKIAHAQSVEDFFTTNVEVDIDAPVHGPQSLSGRDEIKQAVLISRQQLTSLDVKFPDIEDIAVAPDKNSATANVTVDATVSGESNAMVEELKFTFAKTDGEWLIDKVETVRVVTP